MTPDQTNPRQHPQQDPQQDLQQDPQHDVRNAVCRALTELEVLLGAIDDGSYRRENVPGFESAIGAHVRHCLDHVEAVIASTDDGFVRYDHRDRGTPVEFERVVALGAISSARARVAATPGARLDEPVTTCAMVAADGAEQSFPSTRRREFLYAFHHTVHHLALMRAHAVHLGVESDECTGLAPATIAARASSDGN